MTSDHEILTSFEVWSVLGAIDIFNLTMGTDIWNLRVAFVEKLPKIAVSGYE